MVLHGILFRGLIMSFFKSKTVLVTGGAGAIGCNLSKELVKRGCNVIIIDNLSSGFKSNIPKKCRFIYGDICDEKTLKKAFDYAPDIVFHLAANFANQNSVEHPESDLKTNGLGTLRLLKYSKKNKIGKFIYASSSCVYGSKAGPLKEKDASTELDTPYAFSKFLGEQYVNFFNRYFGIKSVILRYFNSYGPEEYPGKYRNVIPNFIYAAMRGEPLTINGTGNETRDFTYVSDVIEGTLKATQSEYSDCMTFNIGFGKETKIKMLTDKINEMVGNKAGVRFVERRKWDHINRRLAFIDKAKRILKYAPKVGLDEGLINTIEWFKNNVRF